MNLSLLTALQKLRYFLATSFPVLARALWPRALVERLAARYPVAAMRVRRVRQSLLGGHVEKAAGVFAVGEYHQDVLDWSRLPREATPVIRAGVLVSGLLCLLLPLAISVDAFPIDIEQILELPGRGTVGAWDVALWVVALSLGWAALLAGAAVASRVAFLPVLVAFLYLNLAPLSSTEKSWWTAVLPLQGILAAVWGESRQRAGTRGQVIAGAVTMLLAGAACAFVGMVAVPTVPWYRGRIPLAIVLTGIPLGLLLWGAAVWLRRSRVVISLGVAVLTLTVPGIVGYLMLGIRAGFHLPASGVATIGTMMTGYLWPLYYFIGVGVVFKLLRQVRTLQRAARELLPPAVAIQLTIAGLIVAAAVLWSPTVLLTPGLPWPGWVLDAADALVGAFGWAWGTPVAQRTSESMRWVVLALGLATLYASRQGRLTPRVVARVQVLALLSWFAIMEYHMELLGIARAPRVTAAALLLFSVFILWVMHRTMLRFVTGESPWWPRPARAALYVAALLFVLLPVHARAAMHDPRLVSEIVYYLFQGIVVFGVPYYLYVYAQRRFEVLPLQAHAALAVFLAGGLCAAAVVVLDRIAVTGSPGAAWAMASQQVAGMLAGERPLARSWVLPPAWAVVRAVLVVIALSAAMWVVRRRTQVLMLRPAAAVFGVVAFAAGMACVAHRGFELPLMPPRLVMLTTPLRQSLWIDEAFIALQLSWLLPALVLAWGASFERSSRRTAITAGIAGVLHIVCVLGWPRGEAWLRSSGVVGIVAAGGIGSFLLLASALRERLDELLTRKLDPDLAEDAGSDRLLTRTEVRVVAFAAVLVAAAVTGVRAWSARLVPQAARGATPVQLPSAWHAVDGGFVRTHLTGDTAHLTIELLADTGDALTVLQTAAPDRAEAYPGFSVQALHNWDHVAPGMVALDFSWLRVPDDSASWALGTFVITPVAPGRMALGAVTYSPTVADRRWDVARVLPTLASASR